MKDGVQCVNQIEQMSAGTYDMILMDVQMPNMDLLFFINIANEKSVAIVNISKKHIKKRKILTKSKQTM